MRTIWSTRGKYWGTRFLRDGDLIDPLPEFERAFEDCGGSCPAFGEIPQGFALCFTDPENRTDHAGRPIRHAFVVWQDGENPRDIDSAIEMVWPHFEAEYKKLWLENPPPSQHPRK